MRDKTAPGENNRGHPYAQAQRPCLLLHRLHHESFLLQQYRQILPGARRLSRGRSFPRSVKVLPAGKKTFLPCPSPIQYPGGRKCSSIIAPVPRVQGLCIGEGTFLRHLRESFHCLYTTTLLIDHHRGFLPIFLSLIRGLGPFSDEVKISFRLSFDKRFPNPMSQRMSRCSSLRPVCGIKTPLAFASIMNRHPQPSGISDICPACR